VNIGEFAQDRVASERERPLASIALFNPKESAMASSYERSYEALSAFVDCTLDAYKARGTISFFLSLYFQFMTQCHFDCGHVICADGNAIVALSLVCTHFSRAGAAKFFARMYVRVSVFHSFNFIY
jgi:hypothetical protein